MAKKRSSAKKGNTAARRELPKKVIINFESSFQPDRSKKIIIYSVIAILCIFLSYMYISYANSVNQVESFPLDDPWIHLTFAKNLAEYQSFSYFKDEMATAGSTSPVYTFLLSIGFLISSNEMLLSYILGIGFFILAAVSFYKLSSFEFPRENLIVLGCTAIFIFDKWMNFISVSGMETTLYIFLLIACIYFYKERKVVPFAITIALTFWTRPDAVAFIGAIAVDYAYTLYLSKKDKSIKLFSKDELIKFSIIAGIIFGLYFLMNLILSGSLLPNTYNAKLTYYSPEFRSRMDFLEFEVWDYFTNGAYAFIMGGFIIAFLKLITDIGKRKYNPNLVYVIFIVALIFIYWLKLPYAHRFGRYLMPVIPFFILVSVSGFRNLALIFSKYLNNRKPGEILLYLIIAGIIIFSVSDYNSNKVLYAEQSKYIYDRQIEAALWIKNNTAPDDIIATHDVGAIGFYSERKIIDVAGLVTPELIRKINDPDYNVYMSDYMEKENVKYLVFLREWYRVVNQDPLFSTFGKLPPEVMDIYEFKPGETHIVSSEVRSILMYAEELLSQKNAQQALLYLNRAAALEPESSYTFYLMSYAYSLLNDLENFEGSLLKAVEIYPQYTDALLNLGNFYSMQGNSEEAGKYLNRVLEIDPENESAKEILRSMNGVQ
jgi:tetratricopeptide (TPR) repeat protein